MVNHSPIDLLSPGLVIAHCFISSIRYSSFMFKTCGSGALLSKLTVDKNTTPTYPFTELPSTHFQQTLKDPKNRISCKWTKRTATLTF